MSVLVRRQLRANRTLMTVMAVLMALFTTVTLQAYTSAFPNAQTRTTLLSGLTNNGALRALYGHPYDIGSATGWLAWRGMSTAAMIMAMWAAFITAGALRGEEESGRTELALSLPRSRQTWLVSVLIAVGLETVIIGVATIGSLAGVGVTQGLLTLTDCAELGLQLMLPAVLFAAVGAVTSQLCGTTRGARIGAAAVLAVAFFVRTTADTGGAIPWARWLTPLGWFEELHPPASPAPAALLAIVIATLALVAVAQPMLVSRDIGLGILPRRDRRAPHRRLLGAPWEAALRDAAPQLTIWFVGTLAYALLLGSLTPSILDFLRSNSTLNGVVGTNFGLRAYLAVTFSLVQLIAALLAVTLVVNARSDESTGRLELLVALPVSRGGWILSRTLLAIGAAFALAFMAAIGLWAGAALAGQGVGLGSLVEAAINSLPLIIVGAAFAAAVLALAPRHVGLVFAPVAAAYLWEAVGGTMRAPAWALNLSPFHALAAVPREDIAYLPAVSVAVIGIALMALASSVFRRRDLVSG